MHRIVLRLGPVTIYSYGFILAVAFIAGIYLAQVRAKKEGISVDKITDLTFYILISSIVGARALFIALNLAYYKDNLIGIFKVWEGGLVFYGGVILAFAVSVWFVKKNKLSFWKVADILSPSLAIGIAIGRIGCLLNGCCYGKITEKWGISFPGLENAPAFSQQVAEGLISPAAQYCLPVIPTQLYDSLSGVAIFLILLVLEKRSRFEGLLFLSFLMLYSISRFVIEGFRYYQPQFIVFGIITVSQLISIVVFLLSLLFFIKKFRASGGVFFIKRKER